VEWSQDKKQVRILLKDEILQSAGKFLFWNSGFFY
jgi:hypothetical protein